MENGLLFDASSVIYALKRRNLKVLEDNYLQWLTVYEVINALWKEAYLVSSLSEEEVLEILGIFQKSLEFMTILDPRPYELEIFKTAVKLGLTAYDSSYVVLAKEKNLELVTEDSELRERAKKLIDVVSLDQVIRRSPT